MKEDIQNKSLAECRELLASIFDEAPQFYKRIAPHGWKNTNFVHLLHPTPKQQYEEHLIIRENIRRLSKGKQEEAKEVSINEFEQDDLTAINEYEEFIYVLALAIYDIFSNDHEVIGGDGKIFDLGSMRGAGRFIADFLNEMDFSDSSTYDYMDFYMGTVWIEKRGDLTPFYEYVFSQLKKRNIDWNYTFPRLQVLNFSEKDDTSEVNPESYGPEEAIQKQREQLEKKKQAQKLQEELDRKYEESFEEAKYQPLSPLVKAYKQVFGKLPDGHPQKEL